MTCCRGCHCRRWYRSEVHGATNTGGKASVCGGWGRFGISSRTVRTGSVTARCYVRSDFDDAFSRYLSDQSVSPVTTAESEPNLGESHLSRLRLVTDAASEEEPRDLADVTDVTDADDDEAAYVALERVAIKDFGS